MYMSILPTLWDLLLLRNLVTWLRYYGEHSGLFTSLELSIRRMYAPPTVRNGPQCCDTHLQPFYLVQNPEAAVVAQITRTK